jgi:predicted naringenin-chalcone synthase
MSRRQLRALAVVALLGGIATGTVGCYTACPAIAYLSAVTVDVSAFPDVAAIQFCVEAKCSPAPGEDATSAANLYAATPQDDGTWSLAFDMATPDTVEIRLFDAQGTLIHESEESIAWTHTGGACPGPSTAEPLVLTP